MDSTQPMKEEILAVRDLSKSYTHEGRTLTVLNSIDFVVRAGETLSIVGPSGSGKSTLLGLCAGLDVASRGTVRIAGVDLAGLDEDGRAAIRHAHVGFVFQSFQLLAPLTALENVMIPGELRGGRPDRAAARLSLERVGLGDRLNHYPRQLSGGEQQRVALARAFHRAPKLLFADEPTGNLDSETAAGIVDLLFQWNRDCGTTLVLVTHDAALAARTGRIIRLHGGSVVREGSKAN